MRAQIFPALPAYGRLRRSKIVNKAASGMIADLVVGMDGRRILAFLGINSDDIPGGLDEIRLKAVMPETPVTLGNSKDAQWLSRKQAALYLCELGCIVSYKTLDRLAVNDNSGNGPPFVRTRKRIVRYKPEDLRAWAKTQVERVE